MIGYLREKIAISTIFGAAYVAYFIAVLVIQTDLEKGDYWCDADGLLIILTAIAAINILYFQIIKPYFGKRIYRLVIKPVAKIVNQAFSHTTVVVVFTLAVFGGLLAFLIIDAWDEMRRLQSLVGIVVLILVGFVFSAAPGKIRWRHIFWGLGIQFILGLLILKWPVGEAIFKCLSGKVTTFLGFTDVGSSFVFGDYLVYTLGVFAFKVLPVTLFFSFCIQILYYFGVMQWFVLKLGWCLQVTIGTTACESVNAAANIFLGQTEAPLLIKPYLWKMTKSEIHAVMTGGFATIAGSVMAAYISFGIDAASLLSASVMNAPAALALSKLFYPEIEKSRTTTKDIKIGRGDEANWLHAAMVGVSNALPMIANIAANLICFYAFVDLCSHVTNWMCVLAGTDEGVCTIENIFGYIYMPVAWVLGVDWSECHKVGELIGMKTIINEFKAYDELAKLVKAGSISKRAELISTYALCGFANISSVGIVLGGLGSLAPERKHDMALIVVRAMVAGSCASFLTSCIAGTMLSDDSISRNATTISSYVTEALDF
ncbi:sodium/nucleoside cotransporter 2-like [Macrobrachium nipponense]|uniref:sodium/nucleoside cotransporter 2-like n=1 Tax=Macrobrachium nipponense TaxID=159736 RepID=UPI0030C8B726